MDIGICEKSGRRQQMPLTLIADNKRFWSMFTSVPTTITTILYRKKKDYSKPYDNYGTEIY
jgi:hypothetical protein